MDRAAVHSGPSLARDLSLFRDYSESFGLAQSGFHLMHTKIATNIGESLLYYGLVRVYCTDVATPVFRPL